ncbi:MAG: ATP-binding protein [Acidobacteriota bacterium]
MANIEGLGVFYLGEEYDLGAKKRKGSLVLYESKHLVTHAVCVGMTGSGKTGLCVSLLEEAALDGIPAIVIDPKGDLGNLLLQFPELRAEDFAEWVNAEEAQQAQVSAEEYGRQQAELWRKGLADWRQDGERIGRMSEAAEFQIYTPGSRMGRPLSILKSFGAPGEEVREDREMFMDRIANAATAVLSLLGIDADPLQSREHSMMSQIFQSKWTEGKDRNLAELIGQIQAPPFKKIGVLDVDSFFPAKERFALAMQVNNLLASPGFAAWMEGEGMEIGKLLRNEQGKPKISVISIAHLNDAERMFFVALLLNEFLGWVRTQSGTSSLRALLYMDEIFGYFPPLGNPPTKKPLLTLLKQARAFGVGVVLATQNPVDLDYKGLANCGTWFIGRLQTERDKARLMEGLSGASAQAGIAFDAGKTDEILSSLGKRVFYLNNVHTNTPVIFQTRWALSYLRGPLTREQMKKLKGREEEAAPAGEGKAGGKVRALAPAAARPVLPPDVVQKFLAARGGVEGLMYYPHLCAAAKVRFTDTKSGIDETVDRVYMTPVKDDNTPVEWSESEVVDLHPDELEGTPEEGIGYAELAGAATKGKSYGGWQKDLVGHIFGQETLEVFLSPELKAFSHPGESEADFRGRIAHEMHEERDAEIEKIRTKYRPKVALLEERLRKAEAAKKVQEEQRSSEMLNAGMSLLGGVLGAMFGRGSALSKTNIGKAATAVKQAGKVMRESQDVGRAGDTVEAVQAQMAELEAEIEKQVGVVAARLEAASAAVERVAIKPKKMNISVGFTALVWAPCRHEAGKDPEAAW